jgi:hypothetical protein
MELRNREVAKVADMRTGGYCFKLQGHGRWSNDRKRWADVRMCAN